MNRYPGITQMRKFLLAALLLAAPALQSAAQAQTPPQSPCRTPGPGQPTPAAKTGAVFLTIVDHGAPNSVIAFATASGRHGTTARDDNAGQTSCRCARWTDWRLPASDASHPHPRQLPRHADGPENTRCKRGTAFRSASPSRKPAPSRPRSPSSRSARPPQEVAPGHGVECHSMDMTMPMSPHTK